MMSEEGENMKKISKLLLAGAGAAAAAGLGLLASGEIMWFCTLTNKGNKLSNKFLSKDEEFQSQFAPPPCVGEQEASLYESAEKKDVYTLNREGDIVCAESFLNTTDSKWVILCHGYSAGPSSMERYARQYYKKGFNVIMPFMRGNERGAKTNGHVAYTMGWMDRIDLLGWIDYIIALNPESKIILHGESMGAATVMMTLGEGVPSNIVCAVEDCGYTSVWDEFTHQMGEMFGLPEVPFMHVSQFAVRRHIGLDFKKASPLDMLRNANTPLLFIHGKEDDFVPYEMSDRLYEAYQGEKDRLSVENAVHAVSVDTDPESYWAKVWSFAGKYIDIE